MTRLLFDTCDSLAKPAKDLFHFVMCEKKNWLVTGPSLRLPAPMPIDVRIAGEEQVKSSDEEKSGEVAAAPRDFR